MCQSKLYKQGAVLEKGFSTVWTSIRTAGLRAGDTLASLSNSASTFFP